MKTFRMSLISARSISLDSTFKGLNVLTDHLGEGSRVDSSDPGFGNFLKSYFKFKGPSSQDQQKPVNAT
jgi:hypothetical protein